MSVWRSLLLNFWSQNKLIGPILTHSKLCFAVIFIFRNAWVLPQLWLFHREITFSETRISNPVSGRQCHLLDYPQGQSTANTKLKRDKSCGISITSQNQIELLLPAREQSLTDLFFGLFYNPSGRGRKWLVGGLRLILRSRRYLQVGFKETLFFLFPMMSWFSTAGPNVSLMLVHRLQRWPNIGPTLLQRFRDLRPPGFEKSCI